jgi:Flp pilus assembly protein TadB
MPRKRRQRRTSTATTFRTTTGWQWRSFPVFFAFVCGAFVMGLLIATPAAPIAFYLALFGVAFGAAHIFTRWLAERRMRRQTPPAEAERERREQHRLPESPETGARPGPPRRR